MTRFSAILVGNEALMRHAAQTLLDRGHGIAAIVTRNPDLAQWAEGQGLRVEDQDAPMPADAPAADWLLSVANLSILKPEMLARGRQGAINFHDGPLPGMAGVNVPVWAILQGNARHAITWHMIDGGIDTGDVLAVREFEISADETALTLNAKSFAQGAESFDDIVSQIETGGLKPQPQPGGERIYFARDQRPEAGAVLDLRRPAEELARLVRALDHGDYWNPLVTPKLALGSERVALLASAEAVEGAGAPGTVLARVGDSLTVATGPGALRLQVVPGQGDLPDAGAQLPLADDAARAALTALVAPVAKQDAYWRRQLAKTTLGRADAPSGEWSSQPVAGPISPLAVAAALALLARRGAGGAISVALRPDVHPATQGLLADWLPLTVTPEGRLSDFSSALAGRIADLAGHGPFAADLLQRAPELRGATAPETGLDLAGRGPIAGTALTLSLGADGITLHHDTARIDAEDAQRLAERLSLALQAGPDTPVAAIGALDPARLDEVLHSRNATAADYRAACIHTLIAETAAEDGAATALVFEDQSLTRAQLEAAANALARDLIAQGVTPDQPVGLFAKRGPELVIGALAILKAGGAYLPLDPDYPQDRLSHYLSDSGAKIVLTQPGLAGLPAGHAARLIPIPAAPPAQDPGVPDSAVGPEHLAYLIYTSGSTGKPKGVMVEHRNVANFFAGMDAVIPVQPGDAWLAVTSLSFDISVLEIFWSLARGLKLVIAGEESRLAVSGNAAPRKSRAAMDFSLFYWGNDDGVGPKKYQLLLDGARFADQNGFTALWTPERHFHAFGGPYPNPSVTGAAAAAVTTRLGIRAGSCVVPLHHPARIAEEWAVIDNLTGGRAAIAVASGWQPDDFVLRPENAPPKNKDAMIAAVDVLRRLWRGETVEFPKADGSPHAVRTQPRPVQAELPIWVTVAGNPETWREAGRLGANVLTHLLGQSVEVVEERIKDYHQALREAGHDPADFTVTLMLHSYLAADRETAREVARGPMKDYLRAAAALVKQYAWDFPAFKRPAGLTNPMAIDLGSLSEEELDGILEFAFLRYFEDSGLFGSVDEAIARVEHLQSIGVGEIACLIDYGISPEVVKGSFPLLAKVCAAFAGADDPDAGDFSIAAQIRRHRVTHLQCTPSMARILVTDPAVASALAGLRCVMLGGEALPPSLVRDLRAQTKAEILNMYGPTETTIWSSVARLAPDQDATPLGPPIANTQLYVLDEAGQPLGDGDEGELWIGGHGVTRGYWNRAELTAAAFRPDPFVRPSDAAPWGARMYRTGDLVRWRSDGQMDFLGRADGQIKLRGFRIELGEIEARLADLPGVREAVVILRPDASGQGRLLAYVTGDAELDEAHLRAALQSVLPQHMLPARITRLESMPLTPNRKIDRKALPEPAAPAQAVRPSAAPSVAPATSSGNGVDPSPVIQQVWAETLGLPSVGARDNFFAIGGHSLLAIQLHRTLRDRLGLATLGVTDVFRFPVLGDYQRHVSGLAGPAKSAKPAEPSPRPAVAAPSMTPTDDPMARRRAMRAQLRTSE